MRIFKLLVALPMVLFLQGCPDPTEPDAILVIANNSSGDIIYYDQYRLAEDTALVTIARPLNSENTRNFIVQSNSSIERLGAFRGVFDDLPDHLLMVYVFSRDTIDQVPWEEIVARNLVLRRYELTEGELDSLDWRIEYP